MYHYVYRIINLINGHFYVGKRSTKKIPEKDWYWGSGKIIEQAIKKYGRNNFKKEIIKICDTEKEAFDLEKSIVTIEFVQREDTYNLVKGGKGWAAGHKLCVGRKYKPETIEKFRYNACNRSKEYRKKLSYAAKNRSPEINKKISIAKSNPSNETRAKLSYAANNRSEEHKEKLKNYLSNKKDSHINALNKSKFGHYWIHHPELKKTTHISEKNLQKYIDEGWKLGRVNFSKIEYSVSNDGSTNPLI